MTTVRRTYNAQSMSMLQDSNKRKEEKIENDVKGLAWDQLQKANLQSEQRCEDKRFIRQHQLQQRERDMEEAIAKAERDKFIKNQQLQQEEALAREVAKLNLDKCRDDKMRQQIRETSIELRELEGQLKAAYMNKERTAQLAEKEALKYDEMARDSEIAALMKDEHERASAADKQKEFEQYEAEVRYQQELETQLEEQERKRQQEYEESLKEKLMIDEVVRKIYEEDQRERERQKGKKDLQIAYIQDFKVQREQWKQNEKDRLEEENRIIAKFADLQKDRENSRQAAKKEQDEFRAGVQKDLSEKIAAQRRAFEEMEQVRQDLYLEEQEEKERQRDLAREEKRKRDMGDLQRVHREQLYFKKLREEAEQKELEEFRQQMMAKFAEDDRIEQMNAQKRRMKQQEHKKAVEKLLIDRQAQFASERERDIQERREESELEAFRKKIIEEERARLLREHAPNLLGYLPKGVIRNQGDLEELGAEYKEAYKPREIDPLDDPTWDSRKK